ncbi:serine/threonine-protein kinase [Mycobacterium sp. Aquia_213]|uniref:serine/threonine-protein kinase n=1 Tax=Mycobacterium sp. Aquia_213 TaxID=2991728 RepID=UPI00227160BB|nr:serine/threonine-protein kinase [Mycobacterium sp. Aquia_213]WAC93197.1 serine/threonine-protein kinase [Mycobacterium sp. Aquia_213]
MDGTPFGRYRLIELLGRGGMGEVWRAHDTSTNRTVAIKLLPPQLAQDQTFVQRFRREAEAAAQLNSPHVVPIHDYGEIDGRLFVNMRLIEGRDLQQVIGDGPLDPARAVRIVEQVARALHAAHKIGLVHRDVKPSNILLDEDDFAYLIDFGIARGADQTRMTGTGGVIGSWPYMSPERLRAGQVDARSDVYALACVLYECLTGDTPFAGDNTEQQITAHFMEPPPRPSITDPKVPATLDPVIANGMAKDPDQRYATTIELATAANAAITDPIARPAQNLNASAAFATQAATKAADPSLAATQHASELTLAASPAGDPRTRKHRRIALAGGAVVLAAIVVAVVVVFTVGSGPASQPAANPKPVAAPNTGPFTGVYRVDFAPSATHGKLDDGGTPSSGQWSVRSACRPTGCVATATATGGATLQSAFVFDDVGGQWRAVAAGRATSPPPGVTGFKGCDFPDDYWTVVTLQTRPDGTLAGQYRALSSFNDCETERTVTFIRIGDVDVNSLPDPASEAPLVPSPAAAWHGHYHATKRRLDTSSKPTSWDATIETDCLRTGDRCMSDHHGANYPFADGKWTFNFDGTKPCDAGGSNPTKIYQEYPLPQPPQNPIPLLTGRGHRIVTGGNGCAGSYDEEVKFERTGD